MITSTYMQQMLPKVKEPNNHARLYRSLRDKLGCEVDVVEDGYLLPLIEKYSE